MYLPGFLLHVPYGQMPKCSTRPYLRTRLLKVSGIGSVCRNREASSRSEPLTGYLPKSDEISGGSPDSVERSNSLDAGSWRR